MKQYSRIQLKKLLIHLLQEESLFSFPEQLSGYPPEQLINPLISSLCHTSERVRWNAVYTLGLVVNQITEKEREAGRIVMRRFLWMLNDESGGIGWGVPEAMAEVMYRNKHLAQEYLHMLVSYTVDDGPELFQDGNFLEMSGLQRGVLWGLIRVADNCREHLVELGMDRNLEPYFKSPDPCVRGLACFLAGCIGTDELHSTLEFLLSDETEIEIVIGACARVEKVSRLAQEAQEKIICIG